MGKCRVFADGATAAADPVLASHFLERDLEKWLSYLMVVLYSNDSCVVPQIQLLQFVHSQRAV